MFRHGYTARRLIRTATLLAVLLGCAAALARPTVWILPPPFGDGHSLRALSNDPDAWAQTRRRIDGIAYADHWLASQFTAPELRSFFRQVTYWHLKFGMEVGALKAWGPTGDQAFDADHRKWDRFIADGARIDSIAMDEPLNFARNHMQQSIGFAAGQTARFVVLVRQNYPATEIGDIEPYPGISGSDLFEFIDAVQANLRQQRVRGLDFVRLDVDWMHFRPGDTIGQAGWEGVREVEGQCHRRGLPFSLIYWAADFPRRQRDGNATDATWEEGIMHEASAFAAAGGVPDQMMIESWIETPNRAVPESEPGTFTRSVLDLTAQFAPGDGLGR